MTWRSKFIVAWINHAAGGVKSARVNTDDMTCNLLEAALLHKAGETYSHRGEAASHLFPFVSRNWCSINTAGEHFWQELW